MPRRTGTRRVLPILFVISLFAGIGVPAAAGDYGSTLGDDQGTHTGAGVTPAIPGLAWVAELPALEFNGRHGAGGIPGYGRPTVVDGEGNALVQASDTNADTSGAKNDQVLVAVDTDTGDEAWRVDDIIETCPVVVGPDGRIWAMWSETLNGERTLVTIDPATGAMTTEFEKAVGDATDPPLAACDDAPMRLSADGTRLILRQEDIGRGIPLYVRVFDISSPTVTSESVIALDGHTDTVGPFGGWAQDSRVAPTGSPGEGSFYLFERTAGVSTGDGDDDVTHVHALVLDDLPATGSILDAGIIDRSVTLGVSGGTTNVTTGGLVVVDDMIYVSAGEQLAGRVPADGSDVNARNFRIQDDGTSLTEQATSVGRPNATREPGEHNWNFERLGGGDGETLVGRYRGSSGVPAGMDADTLEQVWSLDDYGCLSGSVSGDADGNMLFHDFCDGVVLSVTPGGHVRWEFATDNDAGTADVTEGVHTLIGTNDTYDLNTLESFSIDAVTPDGKVVLTAATASGAGFSGLAVFAIDLGTAVERAAGTNRVETAVDISQITYPGGSDVVVIAKAGDYPDALAGAPLAIDEGGPLLLSGTDTLSEVTAAEIDRLGATRAILLGGEAALASAVRDALEDDGLAVERVAGDNRYDTARLVADRIGASEAVVVEGANANPLRGWPDAVAASSWAASTGKAILLVTATQVPDATETALGDMTEVAVVGGEGAVSRDVYNEIDALAGTVERIAGVSRYETSAMVAERSVADGSSLDVVWLATGTGFADALTAGPAAALTSGVLLLVHGSNPDAGQEAYDFLSDNAADIGSVFLVGGEGAISSDVADAVNDALGR